MAKILHEKALRVTSSIAISSRPDFTHRHDARDIAPTTRCTFAHRHPYCELTSAGENTGAVSYRSGLSSLRFAMISSISCVTFAEK